MKYGLLAAILLVAAVLRVSGHNWDSGQHLNADDAYVARVTAVRVQGPAGTPLAVLLDPARSPLNPRAGGEAWVYGALPVYLVKTATAVAAALSGDASFTGYDGTLQTGRVLAGLCDTLTTLCVFIAGWRLWGRRAGLLAAALYALAVLPIQIGHFYIVDPFMTLFMTATLATAILYVQTARRRWLALAGLTTGLALACKLSAAPVALLLVAAVFFVPRRAVLGGLALAGGAAALGLFLGDPFAVLDAPRYVRVMSAQTAVQSGATDLWFTRKYVGTWPVLYLGGQALLLAAGPLVGPAGLAGLMGLGGAAWRARRADLALLLLGAGAYFASVALVEIKWVRYLLPLTPYLCLFATALVVALTPASGARPGAPPIRAVVRGAVLAVLLVSAALGALAVSAIFHTPQTQVAASGWMFAHLAPGTRIGIEATTIPLPLPLPDHPHPDAEYRLVRLDPLADQSSAAASAALRKALAQADVLVLDMTQAAGTVGRLPWRYPVQIRYYELLFAGRLGFAPVYTATSYPTVFGLAIPDDGRWVDASFMDSSHPPIRIFRKQQTLSPAAWDALFATAVAQPSVPTREAP